MARQTVKELTERIAELEAQAAVLAQANEARTTATEEIAPLANKRRRNAWWTVLSAFLIVVGLVLAPVSVVLGYAQTQLTDTQAFVATFAPLADDPAVQTAISDAAVQAITENVDIPGLTAQVFDGVASLGLPRTATDALRLLEAPAAAGVQSLVRSTVTDFVASDAFGAIWAQSLRVSHAQLIATLQGDPNAALSIKDGEAISLQLGPIIAEVRTQLIANGFAFAEVIPNIDRSIVITQVDGLGQVRFAYAAAVGLGIWLPWVSLVLLAAGVLVARRRRVALIAASVGLAVLMGLVGLAIAIGRTVLVTSSLGISPDALRAIFDRTVEMAATTTLAVAVLAIAVAVVAWIAGPSRASVGLRALTGSLMSRARSTIASFGISTRSFGTWLTAHRTLAYAAVAVVASAVVLLVRPLHASTIAWTLVGTVVTLALIELLRSPEREASSPES